MNEINEIKVIIDYNGEQSIFICKKNEKMKDIIIKYKNNKEKDSEEIILLYNGNIIKEDLEIQYIINKDSLDEMKILVYDFEEDEEGDSLVESKEIICPSCKEVCEIEFKDYKISFKNCKNGHYFRNILLNEFNNFQKINEKKIVCGYCNNNKNESYNNQFYKCCNCDTNLCSLCKSKHNKEHLIINYNNKNNLCNKHGERFILFCIECKQDLCDLCNIGNNHTYDFLYKINKNKIKNDNNKLIEKIFQLKKELKEQANKESELVLNNLEIQAKKIR